MFCHQCGSTISLERKVTRQERCPKCGFYLHVCLNCRFFDANAYHQCRETQAEWVSDKKAANFCEYFDPKKTDKQMKSSRIDEARKKLDDLFKK